MRVAYLSLLLFSGSFRLFSVLFRGVQPATADSPTELVENYFRVFSQLGSRRSPRASVPAFSVTVVIPNRCRGAL